MSAASEVGLKQSLRKMEFPVCTKEALNKIGELVCSRTTNIKSMDLALDLMSEFVFFEIDRRGNKRSSPLTALNELQLLDVLFNYVNEISTEVARNTVFLSLFSGTCVSQRFHILSRLVSLSVAVAPNSSNILSCTSVWMQQLGASSTYSTKLAEDLIRDYFHLVPSSVDAFQRTVDFEPHFVANILTAITKLYFNGNGADSNGENTKIPPTSLVETIIYWLTTNNTLCTTAQQRKSALPAGAIAMEATTPIAGLIRWTTLASLHDQDMLLYNQLHLAILHNILSINSNAVPKAVTCQQLSTPIRYILLYNSKQKKEREKLDTALDMYAQAIQVALSRKCVFGKIDEFIHQLKQLPNHHLLNIIIYTHKDHII